MTTPREQNAPKSNPEYQRAQAIIDQSIAKMDDNTHIEYHSTIERDRPPSRWKRWKLRLLGLFS